jgi:hypothetical protein
MTLVLTLSNIDQCVLVADRQLTDGHGQPFVLPETKATILTLTDARFLLGFAGLARVGRSFRMSEWILQALLEASRPDHEARGTTKRLTQLLTDRFREADIQGIAPEHRGSSLLFTGYLDNEPSPNLVCALITNYQNFSTGKDELPWNEFRATYLQAKEGVQPADAVLFQRIGNWLAMDDETDIDRAHSFLSNRPTTPRLIDFGVGLIRKAAGSAASRGTIGMEANSAVLSSIRDPAIDRDQFPVQFGFHPATSSTSWHGANQVVSLPEIAIAKTQQSRRRASTRNPWQRGRSAETSLAPVGAAKSTRNAAAPKTCSRTTWISFDGWRGW